MIRTHIFSLKISLSSLKMDNAAFRKSEELISDIRSSGYFSIFQELNKIEMKTKLVLIDEAIINLDYTYISNFYIIKNLLIN